jgi:hypothetical protein
MMDNEFTEKEVFNRRSATLAPSSCPVEEPQGYREVVMTLMTLMTLMTAGTQLIDVQEQTVNDGRP